MVITYNDFMEFVCKLHGSTLQTMKRKKKFSVYIKDKGLIFVPESTNKERWHSKEYIENVLNRFNETKSFSNSDYNDTVMQSYHLTLIDLYLKNLK